MPEEENKGSPTEFSSDIKTIDRLDEIKKNILLCKKNKDITGWWDWLDCFSSELVSICDATGDKDIDDEFKSTRKYYYYYLHLKKQGIKKIPMYVIDAIRDFEMFLRNTEQKAGLGVRKQGAEDEEPEDWD